MDSPISAADGRHSAAASTPQPIRYFNPENFFDLPHPRSQARRSSRMASSRRTGALASGSTPSPGAYTLAAIAASTRSSTSQSESAEIPNNVASYSRSTTRAARKRRHHGAENPEGLEGLSPASSSWIQTSSAKRRRTSSRASSNNKRSGSLKTPTSSLKPPPPSVKAEEDEKKPAAKTDATENCCICMGDVEPNDLAQINGCDHSFCFGCIEKWSERENTCPLCKCRFTKIDRINKKRKKGAKNSKKVKQRDQRSDLLPGAAIEGLLASLASSRGGSASSAGLARIIFGVTGSASGPFSGSSAAGSAANQALSLMDSDDDEESPFSLFRNFGAGAAGFRFSAYSSASGTSIPSASFSIRYSSMAAPPPQPPNRVRSHATNGQDANAGNRENPLEIASDSDDDSVEVLEIE